MKVQVSDLEDVGRLCKQCKLTRLNDDLAAALLKSENFGRSAFTVYD